MFLVFLLCKPLVAMQRDSSVFEQIPNEVMHYLFHFVAFPANMDEQFQGLKNLLTCRQVCKKWNELCTLVYDRQVKKESDSLSKKCPFIGSEFFALPSEAMVFIKAIKRNFLFFVYDYEKRHTITCERFENPTAIALNSGALGVAWFLLFKHQDVNTTNPLREAICKGYTQIAKELVRRGAKTEYHIITRKIENLQLMPTILSDDKFNAQELAAQYKNSDLVQFIKDLKNTNPNSLPKLSDGLNWSSEKKT